jgi:hypothetical protein
MRLRRPSGRPLEAAAGRAGRGVGTVVIEALRIAREMLVIPAQIWLLAAELIGAAVLAGWRRMWPFLVAGYELARRALAWAEDSIAPAHGLLAVALFAAAALGASQFVDYRGISVGTPDYAGVDTVAPAPEVDRKETGSAHAYLLLLVAAAAGAVVVASAFGRWRLLRLLVPLGVVAIVVSLAIDVPKGLDEGSAAVSYEGAAASLLEGFWMQLSASAVLIFCGLLAGRMLPAGVEGGLGRRLRRPSLGESGLDSGRVGEPPIGWRGESRA